MNRGRTRQFKPNTEHKNKDLTGASYNAYRTVELHGHLNGGYINDESLLKQYLSNGRMMYTRRLPHQQKAIPDNPVAKSETVQPDVSTKQGLGSNEIQQETEKHLQKTEENAEEITVAEDTPESVSKLLDDAINSPEHGKGNIKKEELSKDNIINEIEKSARRFSLASMAYPSMSTNSATNNNTNAYEISDAIDNIYVTVSGKQSKRSTLPTHRTASIYTHHDAISMRSTIHDTKKQKSFQWTPKWLYPLFAICLWTFVVLCIQTVGENKELLSCSFSETIRLWLCYGSIVLFITISAWYIEKCSVTETIVLFFFIGGIVLILHPVPLMCVLSHSDWQVLTAIRAAIALLFAIVLLTICICQRIVRH